MQEAKTRPEQGLVYIYKENSTPFLHVLVSVEFISELLAFCPSPWCQGHKHFKVCLTSFFLSTVLLSSYNYSQQLILLLAQSFRVTFAQVRDVRWVHNRQWKLSFTTLWALKLMWIVSFVRIEDDKSTFKSAYLDASSLRIRFMSW